MSYFLGKAFNAELYNVSDDPTVNNSSYLASITAVNTVNNSKINLNDNRGELAGYETVKALTGNQTITINSPDSITMNTSGNVKLTFTPGTSGQHAVKVIALKATGTTTLTIANAVWANGAEAPTWGTTGKNLVLVANFIRGRVILNVFDNDEEAS